MTSWPRRVARDGSTALAAGLVMLVGLWAAGGVVTDDATTAKVLTGAWFAATGVVALLLARTRQVTAIAVLAGCFVPASLTGSFLLFTSTVDRVVDLGGLKATRASNSTSFRGRRASDPLWSGAAPSASSSASAYCKQPTSSAEFLSASGNPTRMAVGSVVGVITPRDA